jgi:hypothetical protein
VIFHYVKVAKHIWEPCCHLAADTGSWFPILLGNQRINLVDSAAKIAKFLLPNPTTPLVEWPIIYQPIHWMWKMLLDTFQQLEIAK